MFEKTLVVNERVKVLENNRITAFSLIANIFCLAVELKDQTILKSGL